MMATTKPVLVAGRMVEYRESAYEVPIYLDTRLGFASAETEANFITILRTTRLWMEARRLTRPIYFSTNLDGTAGGESWQAAAIVASTLAAAHVPITGSLTDPTTELRPKVLGCMMLNQALIIVNPEPAEGAALIDLLNPEGMLVVEVPALYTSVNYDSAEQKVVAAIAVTISELFLAMLFFTTQGAKKIYSEVTTPEEQAVARAASAAALAERQAAALSGDVEVVRQVPRTNRTEVITVNWKDRFPDKSAIKEWVDEHADSLAARMIPESTVLNGYANEAYKRVMQIVLDTENYERSGGSAAKPKGAAAREWVYPPDVTSAAQKMKYREKFKALEKAGVSVEEGEPHWEGKACQAPPRVGRHGCAPGGDS